MSAVTLSAEHRAHLADSAISDAVIEMLQPYTVDDPRFRQCLALPWHKAVKDSRRLRFVPYIVQLRPDKPRRTLERHSDGTVSEKEHKYEWPAGEPRQWGFFPGDEDLLKDAAVPCILVEGWKQASAVKSWFVERDLRVLVIALVGCWGATEKNADGVHQLHHDGDLVAWRGRAVLFITDSDTATNPLVAMARDRACQALCARGAEARTVDLPQLDGMKKAGIDDLLARHIDLDALFADHRRAVSPQRELARRHEAFTETVSQALDRADLDDGAFRVFVAAAKKLLIEPGAVSKPVPETTVRTAVSKLAAATGGHWVEDRREYSNAKKVSKHLKRLADLEIVTVDREPAADGREVTVLAAGPYFFTVRDAVPASPADVFARRKEAKAAAAPPPIIDMPQPADQPIEPCVCGDTAVRVTVTCCGCGADRTADAGLPVNVTDLNKRLMGGSSVVGSLPDDVTGSLPDPRLHPLPGGWAWCWTASTSLYQAMHQDTGHRTKITSDLRDVVKEARNFVARGHMHATT